MNHGRLATSTDRPCRGCEWWVRDLGNDTAECANPGCSKVRSNASHGCSAWIQAPGVDLGPETQKKPLGTREGTEG